MANNVQITIGADASNAESALKKFQGSVRMAGLALSAMGAGGALAIKGFTSAALEQERALKTLAAVVENTGESFSQVEAKILAATSALQKKSNFGDEEQIRVLAKLVPMLGSTDAALAALPAALELAAVTGKDLNSVVDTMGPVLAGVTDRIRGTTLEFTAAQGPTERLAQIMEVLGGSAEADMDPFRQLSMAMGDLSEKIGDALLPVIVPLIEKLAAFAEKLQTVNPAIIKFGAVLLVAVTAIGLIGGPLLLLVSVLPNVMAGFNLVKAGILGAKTAMLAFNATMLANPVVLIIAGIVGAVALLALAWSKNFGNIREVTREVVTFIAEFYQGAINKIINGVQFLGDKLSFLLPEGVEDALAGIPEFDIAFGEKFDSAVGAVDDFAENLQDKFKEFMFPTGEEAGEQIGDGVIAGVNEKLKVSPLKWELKVPSLTDNLNTLGLEFDDARDRVFALTSEGMSSFEAWEKVTEHFASKVDQKFNDIVNNYGKIDEASLKTAETAEQVAERMAAAAEAAAARIAAAFSNKAGALGFNSNLVGIGAMESFAGLTGSALIDKVAEVNASIAGIAGMADGGIVGGPKGSPQLRVVHGGEMVLNDEQQSGMGSTFNITVNGNVDDPAQMARLIADQVNQIMGESSIRNEATRSR